jgi:hypothetical protein
MNKNKIAIESLSMDLLRVANGLHKGSRNTAQRFSEEARVRCSEIKKGEVKPNFAQILDKVVTTLSNLDEDRTAEDALMYSVLCKNYARKYLS